MPVSQAFPEYTDCHMRLACIEHARGNSDAALAWVRQALERKPNLADALGRTLHISANLHAGGLSLPRHQGARSCAPCALCCAS